MQLKSKAGKRVTINISLYYNSVMCIEKIAAIWGVEIKDLFDFEHFQQKKVLLDDISALLSEFDTKK